MATSGLLFEMLKVFKVLIVLGIFGLALIISGIVISILPKTESAAMNQSTTEQNPIILKDFFVHNSSNVNCDKITYSENWTLSFLREIARLCSNGQ